MTAPPPDSVDDPAATTGPAGRDLVAGGTILAVAMFVANAGNYLLNVFLGRWLTPAEFADANLMVTLMLLVTAVAVSLQLIAAKFASVNVVHDAEHETHHLATLLRRRAAIVGVVLGAALAVPSRWWAEVFNSESALPFIILGVGLPAYLVQAVGRGVLQGRMEFRPLALTFVWEMLARVAVGVGLVAIGWGVSGATLALTVSFVVTWWTVRRAVSWPEGAATTPSVHGRRLDPAVVQYAAPVAVLLFGQILVNNGDVLVSKWSLDPTTAGIYAAIALVGRAVFFLSWSVATTLFPAAAQREEAGDESDSLLYAGLGLVAALGLIAVVGARTMGGLVLSRVFGEAYAGVSTHLAAYAFATALFAMANLVVSHHLALGRIREAIVLVAGGVAQTALLFAWSSSVSSLIRAQVLAMIVLFLAVGASHVLRTRSSQPSPAIRRAAA